MEVAALRVRNPAFTYDYDLVPAAITADRQLNWPLITDTDTLVALALAQTLTNKTLTAPAISQVVFPAAQVASTGANTLDDYEEGAWTPAVTFGGAAVSVTYGATNLGRYVKIGNHVFITGILILTSKGSSTGAAVITGLPFTSRADNGTFTVASIRPETVSFANQAYGRIGTSATTIDLEEVTEAGAITTLDNTNFANASTVAVGLHYEVTA